MIYLSVAAIGAIATTFIVIHFASSPPAPAQGKPNPPSPKTPDGSGGTGYGLQNKGTIYQGGQKNYDASEPSGTIYDPTTDSDVSPEYAAAHGIVPTPLDTFWYNLTHQ